jgi:hypothetical protein
LYNIGLHAAEQNMTISYNTYTIDVNLFDMRKDGRGQTMKADRIVYCSDFERLNDDVIRDFAHALFPDKDLPELESGHTNLIINPNEVTIYFYAGSDTISSQGEKCLKSFTAIYPKFYETLDVISDQLGKKPDYFKDIPYGKFFTPVFATPAAFRYEKNIFVVYLSIAESPGRITRALSYLFGLNFNSCGENDACLELYYRNSL